VLARHTIEVDEVVDDDGDWTVNAGPEGSVDVSSGVVPDELRLRSG
jgi:hypothetical protein